MHLFGLYKLDKHLYTGSNSTMYKVKDIKTPQNNTMIAKVSHDAVMLYNEIMTMEFIHENISTSSCFPRPLAKGLLYPSNTNASQPCLCEADTTVGSVDTMGSGGHGSRDRNLVKGSGSNQKEHD